MRYTAACSTSRCEWHPQRRIGEQQRAIGGADHVIRAVQPLALEPVDQRRHRAVRLGSRDAAAVAFAVDQAALQVEGRAVAAFGLAHHLRLVAHRQAIQHARTDIDEIEEAVGMPERSLGEDETGRHLLKRGRFEYVRQGRHC